MSLIRKTLCSDKHSIRPPCFLRVLSSYSSASHWNRFAGTYPSRLCTCNTNTHPLTPEDFFVFPWSESHLLCKPCNIISLRKLFAFQYLKRQKGKHRQFIWLLYSLRAASNHTAAHVTASDDSHKVPFQLFAVCLITLPRACSHKSHLQNVVLLPAGAKKREPICTFPK